MEMLSLLVSWINLQVLAIVGGFVVVTAMLMACCFWSLVKPRWNLTIKGVEIRSMGSVELHTVFATDSMFTIPAGPSKFYLELSEKRVAMGGGGVPINFIKPVLIKDLTAINQSSYNLIVEVAVNALGLITIKYVGNDPRVELSVMWEATRISK